MDTASQLIFFAILGGVLPALFWLWLWLKEDYRHPEPRRRIAATFLAGMLAVPLVLPFERIVYKHFSYSVPATFLLWAILEELFKFIAAGIAALRSKDDDEPIDDVIYLLTAALGFAACENILFLINPAIGGSLKQILIVGNLRFLGTSLLHTVSTAMVGVFIAFSFYENKLHKALHWSAGLILAIILHTCFNLLIIRNNGNDTYTTIGMVWLGIPILMVLFQRIKRIRPTSSRHY